MPVPPRYLATSPSRPVLARPDDVSLIPTTARARRNGEKEWTERIVRPISRSHFSWPSSPGLATACHAVCLAVSRCAAQCYC
ncbi:hypothetical protein BDZ90DRAFT_234140 [Jaminaea rosea]|uniref:Uncharacterized protein n=1 Tax=Jaminaea rosea TaxID=1569628 RepID=A0A316UQ82_9BASI|nr:hypothetical protein BDZ90DRAFT_234140 [Jaminaea rosea]PWN25295.1 hypothetical protein BDZ90DRAFT_234140 [Jaminaea rosea]